MHYSTHLLRHLRVTIGQNIHTARLKQKMTLRTLSKKSDVPEYLIDQYELGKNQIGLEQLLRIACVLGIKAESLLCSS
jgi:transcriptional regulator with XRE-family HTH domain